MVRVDSRCEQKKLPEKKDENKKEGPEERKRPQELPENVPVGLAALALPEEVCQVVYTIINGETSKASVTEFSVGDETFQFPVAIAPGKKDEVTITKVKPAECKKEKIGTVKLTCAGGGGMTLNKLEVCVLS